MARPLKAIFCAAVCAGAFAPISQAQAPASNPSDWNRPYGQLPGGETQPYQGARGLSGNRVVINGIIQTGVGVSAQASAMAQVTAQTGGGVNGGVGGVFANASASAIGNQLNVVVNGNYNTVVVNSTQTNTGNVIANAGAGAASANGQTSSEASDDNR